MERTDFQIISYTGSGVAWLLNFLLELDILVYRGDNIQKTWDFKDGHFKLKKGENVLKQWCPVLTEKEEFESRENIAVRWSHEFPNYKNIQQKTILLVRDGRDCIYSQFKREKLFPSFDLMISAGVEPFNLNPADTWALMNLMWSNSVPKENLFVIKFEDIKTDPQTVLQGLLEFLGVSRNSADIQVAIESSSFERAKKFEEAYRATASRTQFELVNRKGQPGEWREVYNSNQITFFNGLPDLVLKYYGYEAQNDSDAEQLENLLDQNMANSQSVDRNTDRLTSSLLKIVSGHEDVSPLLTEKFVAKNYNFLNKALCLIKNKEGLKLKIKKESYNKTLRKIKKKLSSIILLRKIRNNVLKTKQKIKNIYYLAEKKTLYIIRKIKKPKIPINSDGKVLIHLGCGNLNNNKFINVDIEPLPHIHYIQDIKKLDTFPDNFSDLIYASHALEHIGHSEILTTLTEWARVLKKGGTIRLSVPDFDKLIEIYNISGGNISNIKEPLMGGQNYEYNYHKSIFNEKYLSDMLIKAGFINIRRWDPEKVSYHFDDFAKTFKASLNIEAEKN